MSRCFLKLSATVILSGLVVLAQPLAGSADESPTVAASQNAKLNVSIIQLRKARGTNIEIDQRGTKNISIATQVDTTPESGVIEVTGKESFARHSLKQEGFQNFGASYQDSQLNESSIHQFASDTPPDSTSSPNSLTIADIGDDNLLIHFKSGDVDFLSVTSGGYSATSRFGRAH